MKKYFLFLFIGGSFIVACNSDTPNTVTTTETTTGTDTAADTPATATSTAAAPAAPLNATDSTFVMEAASGGMMEVEAGNLAQQKASSQRVKDFAAMMIRDHSKANDELKSMASSRNLMLPDSMMKKHKAHLNAMQRMNGKAFDKHYMDMMVNAHKEDVTKFEKASTSAGDADLKAWAAKTLPVLLMHRDSAQAIYKTKM